MEQDQLQHVLLKTIKMFKYFVTFLRINLDNICFVCICIYICIYTMKIVSFISVLGCLDLSSFCVQGGVLINRGWCIVGKS